jgi:oligopeptide transport system permease protein
MTAKSSVAGGMALKGRKDTGSFEDAVRRLLRNRAAVLGGIIIICLILSAIFAGFIAPRDYAVQTLEDNNSVPSWLLNVFPTVRPYANVNDAYPIGADYVGRDMLSRIIYGTRVSLSVALMGPLISIVIGLMFGTIAGYFGKTVDNLMMRFVDVMYAFPTLLLIILLMALFRSTTEAAVTGTLRGAMADIDGKMGGMFFIYIGIGITAWMGMARLARGQILSLKEKEFIEAARAMGANDLQIMTRHILPNIIGPLIVSETLAIPTYINFEAFLSFIGLGVNPPTPSWGSMIADGSASIRSYPNQAVFPALALAITMFAFNFLGDGLRDALDPRMKGTS